MSLLGLISDEVAQKLGSAAHQRVSAALNEYLAAKSSRDEKLLDALLPAFSEAGIERHVAFALVDQAEVERKARRRAELEAKSAERKKKKAAKTGDGGGDATNSNSTPSISKADHGTGAASGTPETQTATESGAIPESLLNVTSQQSRFHAEAIETASKEVDLKTLNVAVGQLDLLEDAHLRLKDGVKYGLVGRNGTGKSTLMRCIAHRLIPGLSPLLKIVLVSQVEDAARLDSATADASAPPTALQFVVDSDVERKRSQQEFDALSNVMESAAPTAQSIHDAVASIHLDRSKEALAEAQRIASRRSGQRGAEARKRLLEAEAHFKAQEQRTNSRQETDWYTANDAGQLLAELGTVLEQMDASTAESRARSILRGLGFSADQVEQPVPSFSGGWRSRISLASALLCRADILLLDEPVNYLDIPGVIWLEHFLMNISCTVVTVSHDRAFCDATSEELIILAKKKLNYFEGNLSAYEAQGIETCRKNKKLVEGLDRKKAHMQKSIEEGRRTALKTGDDNRMRMVKSREKKLDQRWGLERSSKGFRFKFSRDWSGEAGTTRYTVTLEGPEKAITWAFPDPEPLRFPGALVHLEDVSFRYPKAAKPTLAGVSLTINPGDRIGLVGANGRGKTTLINMLTKTTAPSSGVINFHPQSQVAHYNQHSVEKLASVQQTALARFMESSGVSDGDGRGFLGMLGLQGRIADSRLVSSLSGGQRVRLALAEVMWLAADLLVLDEVTTHLDADSTAGLIDALRAYTGAIVLASHDRYAVQTIIEGLRPKTAEADESSDEDGSTEGEAVQVGRTYLVQSRKVTLLEHGVEEYVEQVQRTLSS